ncbi:MAG: hypothetical protein ACJAYU_004938 [Bradymonadia bacterium]
MLLAVGYTLSGIDKAGAPSWQDGSTLSHVLSNPLAHGGWLGAWLLDQPTILVWSTWAALALEISFAPLCVSKRLRPFVWAAMVSVQVGIIVLVDFADLTWGMLAVHAWTFDGGWLRRLGTFRRGRSKATG